MNNSDYISLANKDGKTIALLTLFLICVVMFIVNPFVTSLIVLFWGCQKKELTRTERAFVSVVPAIFLGLFNSTKVPENDLEWYIDFYSDAGSVDFFDYFLWIGIYQHVDGIKEPFYTLFTYCSYYLLGGNKQLFVLFHSTICYSVINYSLYKLGSFLNIKNSLIITSIVYADFCPFIFTMSAHLLRQILANVFLIYIIVDIICIGKFKIKHFLLCIIMMLTHSSSTLFIPVLMLKFLERPIKTSNCLIYIFVCVIILSIQLLATALLPFVQSLGPIGLIVFRASVGTTYEMEGLSFFKIAVSVFISLTCFVLVYRSKFKENYKIVHFSHLLVFLCVFFLGNIHMPELAIRYNFYIWLLSPIVFILMLHIKKIDKFVSFIIAIVVIAFFIFYMEYGSTWNYRINGIYLYSPVSSYIM